MYGYNSNKDRQSVWLQVGFLKQRGAKILDVKWNFCFECAQFDVEKTNQVQN